MKNQSRRSACLRFAKRLRGDLAEIARCQITLDVLEISMVKQIVELPRELEIQLLLYVRILVKSCVRVHEGRISELVELLVALANASRCRELPRGETTRGIGIAGRSLPVAGSVWKIKGVSIRIVIPTVPKIGAGKHSD